MNLDSELSRYHYTLEPYLMQGNMFITVREWEVLDGSRDSAPKPVTEINHLKDEAAALKAITQLRLARRDFVLLKHKYGGMVL